jgi:septal ring factor EnvC (AmiA/AmiB activator)
MPVDLKSELTRPFALILAALAVLGWVLFVLSSWSAASVQKSQRLRLVEVSEKHDKVAAELARQVEASGSLAELQSKVASTRDDLTRVSQTRSDVQTELLAAQRNLSTVRRELTEADRTLQSQAQKLSDVQTTGDLGASAEPQRATVARSGRRGRWSRRGRASRSFSVNRR